MSHWLTPSNCTSSSALQRVPRPVVTPAIQVCLRSRRRVENQRRERILRFQPLDLTTEMKGHCNDTVMKPLFNDNVQKKFTNLDAGHWTSYLKRILQ